MQRTTIGAIIAVVVIVLIIGVYFGVISRPSTTSTSTTSTSTPTPVTSSTTTSTSTPIPTTNVTISFWEAFDPAEYHAFVTIILPAFEAKYPNIKVVITNVTFATSNFETAAAAHQAPNVYVSSNNDLAFLFSSGFLVNLSQYINSSYMSMFAPTTVEAVTVNNSVFALPMNENGIVMFYNKQLIPNASILQSTGTLIPYLIHLNETEHVWGFAYGMGAEGGYRFAAWLGGFGGRLFSNYAYGTPELNSTAMIDALQFWYNLTYQPGLPHINAPLGSGSGVAGASGLEGSLFENGKAAIIFDGPWDLVPLFNALGTNLGAAPLPMVSSTGDYFAPILGANAIAVVNSQASGATPAQIQASIKFAEFMVSPLAQQAFFNYSGDFPSLSSQLSSIEAQAEAGTLLTPFAKSLHLSAAEFSGVMKGIIDQYSGHTIPQPVTPLMNYYYSGVASMGAELTLYYTNKTITAQDLASCVQAFVESRGSTVLPVCSGGSGNPASQVYIPFYTVTLALTTASISRLTPA